MGLFNPVLWILAAIVILLVFGPQTLSKVARTAGRTVRTATNVKKTITGAPSELIRKITAPDPPADKPR